MSFPFGQLYSMLLHEHFPTRLEAWVALVLNEVALTGARAVVVAGDDEAYINAVIHHSRDAGLRVARPDPWPARPAGEGPKGRDQKTLDFVTTMWIMASTRRFVGTQRSDPNSQP